MNGSGRFEAYDPPDYSDEPAQRYFDDARDELPADATDEEIYTLACMLALDDVRGSHDDDALNAADHEYDDVWNDYDGR